MLGGDDEIACFIWKSGFNALADKFHGNKFGVPMYRQNEALARVDCFYIRNLFFLFRG